MRPQQEENTTGSGLNGISQVYAFRFNSAKRQLVRALFEGKLLRFQTLMGWSARDFPETRARAEAALATARNRPAKRWLVTLRLLVLRLQYNATREFFGRHPGAAALTWNGLVSTRNIFIMAARDAGAPTLFLERGPFPGTITADPHGVNEANGLSRDPDSYMVWAAENPESLGAWRVVAGRIVGRPPARRAAVVTGMELPPLEHPFVFVPLQKQGDTQLRIFGGPCRTVEATVALIEAAADALPRGWHIRIKEHPTDRPRLGPRALELQGKGIYLDNATETFAQVQAAKVVVTVNSSVGLEAMMFMKPVIVLGQAFWALPGLALTAAGVSDLRSRFASIADAGFDARLRDAFLSYLVSEYYPVVGPLNARSFSIHPEVRQGVLRRMQEGRVP